jgi:hypothetical protein
MRTQTFLLLRTLICQLETQTFENDDVRTPTFENFAMGAQAFENFFVFTPTFENFAMGAQASRALIYHLEALVPYWGGAVVSPTCPMSHVACRPVS